MSSHFTRWLPSVDLVYFVARFGPFCGVDWYPFNRENWYTLSYHLHQVHIFFCIQEYSQISLRSPHDYLKCATSTNLCPIALLNLPNMIYINLPLFINLFHIDFSASLVYHKSRRVCMFAFSSPYNMSEASCLSRSLAFLRGVLM